MPKITVIIPIYNAELYLERCIDSIVNQSFKDIELICVNDGSTDNSEQIIKKYQDKHNNIILISKKNKGVSAARNIGLERSNSDYIYFVDADDWLSPDCLESIYNAAISSQADIIYFNANIYKNNTLINYYNLKRLKSIKNKDLLFKMMIHAVWNKLYKKEFLLKNDIKFPVGIKSSEDNIFNEMCHFHAPKYFILDKKLYNYNEFNLGAITSNLINTCFNEIESFRYIINTAEFKHSNNSLKKVMLQRHIRGLLCYTKRIETSNTKEIKEEIKKLVDELYENDNIQFSVGQIKTLNLLLYPIIIGLMKTVLNIQHTNKNGILIITILGKQLKFKRGKYDNK
jgi:glycosyltransferase involved in cell wall biosynthesis